MIEAKQHVKTKSDWVIQRTPVDPEWLKVYVDEDVYKRQYYCFNSTIIFREKSKNTILAFTFCSICSCASLSSSMMPITFLSKKTEK